MKERGIIREVSIGRRGMMTIAFVCSVLWVSLVMLTAIDGVMVFGVEVQSFNHLFQHAALQSAFVFTAVLFVWFFWNVILNLAWIASLFVRG